MKATSVNLDYLLGDVRVSLNSLKELPYIMELVQQAFDKQIDDVGQ